MAVAVTLLRYFNSIKVRLKRLKDFLNNELKLFQFHKGTIKTQQGQYQHFNSIKVRLKLIRPKRSAAMRSHFNSIKVRLKQLTIMQTRWPSRFQFHKGTIKTLRSLKNFAADLLFQFHKGTIKTYVSFRIANTDAISIP